ncbi:ATP/GTP-binding protein [Chamaesiphon sp. GL140_3_metabinner_50]|uniref:AAA family ATPase n=1 Tax=Chamaesiphon sp. GL140_3_metabinner_50 TaxID=2970812 RepID=UPI0025D16830|nr:ATP-binding protein [Chamaesiphon sp. GL140_3_metabinner_50]
MIEDIEITNFRCFDRLKVSGCKRINLISGKNNVGKTALLEAIFINNTPTKDTIISIGDLRRESSQVRSEFPAQIWDNLFWKQNLDPPCVFHTIFQDASFKTTEIFVRNEQDILTVINSNIPAELVNHYDEWLEKEKFKDGAEQSLGVIIINVNNQIFIKLIALSRNREVNLDTTYNKSVYLQNTSFIPSTLRASTVSLTQEFDRARLNEKDEEVLKAFQIIDSSIVAVESFSIPEPTIYLKRQGEKRLPLSLFGDAMNRIADIILKIINNQDSILLIDEIENGIHHSNQTAFWDFLYRLAEQLNVQIFATTHSLEMTEAFIKAGIDRQDSAAHFELTRHEKTNKIVAINRDLETLEYGITHHKEVRGGS